MSEVRVIARVQAHDGKAAEVRALMRRMLEPTRKERGCKFYDLYESTGQGGSTGGGLFYFDELWATQADLDAHAASPHFQQLFGEAAPMLQYPPDVTLLAKLEPIP